MENSSEAVYQMTAALRAINSIKPMFLTALLPFLRLFGGSLRRALHLHYFFQELGVLGKLVPVLALRSALI